MIEYAGIYPKNNVEYARIILNVSDAVYSISSLTVQNSEQVSRQSTVIFKIEHLQKE